MHAANGEFERRVVAVLTRFFAQNAQPLPPPVEIEALAARLQAALHERGLPPPLRPGEAGAPREMTDAECAPLVQRVLGGQSHPLLAEAVRQLVKACFYPEFRVCRESYCAEGADGACRRQELERARKRVSGSHCVDCPYWQELDAAAHAALLQAHWRSAAPGAVALAEHRGIFLPEDFRALRRHVRELAR